MVEIGKTVLDKGWLAARSTEVDLTGIQLTTTHPPSPKLPLPWMDAHVPGTVLATLLKNQLIPDPFYGLENESIIDIADSGRDYYTFWFFTSFQCKPMSNQHVDLNFRAINYSGEVYLNGHRRVLPKGMFRRHCLDVTDILHPDGQNLLAVIVYPPDHPGKIPPEGGQGGDHEIGKDVATQYVEGWDWMAPIRDRNTGIWDEVSVSVTGPVKIVDPHLVSSFFDGCRRVYLHATTELVNKSASVAECDLNIQVTTELEGNICLVEHLQKEHVSILPGGHVQYTFPEEQVISLADENEELRQENKELDKQIQLTRLIQKKLVDDHQNAMMRLPNEMNELKAKLSTGLSSQSTPALTMKDNTSEGEKERQEKAGNQTVQTGDDKGKRVMVAESSRPQGEQNPNLEGGELDEPYAPDFVENVPGAKDLIEEDEFVDEDAYDNDCVDYGESIVTDFEQEKKKEEVKVERKKLRIKRAKECEARQARMADIATKEGPEWDTAWRMLVSRT